MGRVANPQLSSEWRARLERWQKSGLGVREFCVAEDVGVLPVSLRDLSCPNC
jgi:hypothetical protein